MSVSWRRAGQTDIRGLVTAGRAVRLEVSAALKGERGNENPVAAHSLIAGHFHALPQPCPSPPGGSISSTCVGLGVENDVLRLSAARRAGRPPGLSVFSA